MTRARQVANFDPALFAADEVSGDKVSGGTIGAGVIGASVTGGAGLTGSTSLGTVATGTWEGTDVAVAHGGTGASTHTANNVLVGAGPSAITSVAPGSDGNVLTSTGTVWNSEDVFSTFGIGATFHKSINGSDSTQTFYTDDSIFMGSYLVPLNSVSTVTTPTNFTASDCILMGGRRSISTAGNLLTQNFPEFNVCNFTAASTISLYNSSGYSAYIYFCCIRFK